MLKLFIHVHYRGLRNWSLWSLSNEVKAQHLDSDVLRKELADI